MSSRLIYRSSLHGQIIPGDITNSNIINVSDISALNLTFGSQTGDTNYLQVADYNCDGFISLIDLSILGERCGMMGNSPAH